MNDTQFRKFVDAIRCLNSIGYIMRQHVKYENGSHTIFFEPYHVIDTVIRPESISEMLSNSLLPEMCVSCYSLDNVQLHILPKRKDGNK